MLFSQQYRYKIRYKISFYRLASSITTLFFIMVLNANSLPANGVTTAIQTIQISHHSTNKPLLSIQHPPSASPIKNKIIVVAIALKNSQKTTTKIPQVILSKKKMHRLNGSNQQVLLKSTRFQIYWYYLLEKELPLAQGNYEVTIHHESNFIHAGIITLSNVKQVPPIALARRAFRSNNTRTLHTPIKTQHADMLLLDMVIGNKNLAIGRLVPDYLQKVLWRTTGQKNDGQTAVSMRRINTPQDTTLIWRWKSLRGDLQAAATTVIGLQPAISPSSKVDAGEDQTLSVWRGPNPIPATQRPAYLQPFIDPVYHSTITRITDESQDGYNKNPATLRHNYPNDQVWNTDMSLIKLNFGQIRDAKTYKLVRLISKDSKTGKSYDEILWSNVHSDILYGLNNNSFSRYSLKTGEWTVLRTFNDYGKLTTNYMSSLSNDDRYIALNDKKRILVYDLIEDKITGTIPMGNITTASMSQSGNYVLATTKNGFFAYDKHLNFVRKLSNTSNHDDFGYDAHGNEVVIQMCPVRMVQINNGKVTDLLGLSYVCGHVSARNYKKPGWAYVSANIDPNDDHYGPHIATEIMEIKLDDSGIVNTLAHSRTTSHDYESHALVVVSPDGSQVIFGSDWGDKDGTVYDYVIDNKNRGISQTTLQGKIDRNYFSSSNPLQITWRKLSGEGRVTFENKQTLDTHVTFSTKGRYVLQLHVSDGVKHITDEVTITVGTM